MRARRLGGGDARRFRVVFHPAAAREYDALPEHARVRFERAIDALEDDPFSARPGVDIRKLRLLSDGTTLRRLRVGERRACYAVVTPSREVWILMFEDRELGYARIIRTSVERFERRPRG
ncbi:MAG TPA: hypothetical protein VI997_06525 [Candidatus Thermoplasmatota archaeon]|nr:hypothetical protein [Candidatus Thermoplasmatota archaeon]